MFNKKVLLFDDKYINNINEIAKEINTKEVWSTIDSFIEDMSNINLDEEMQKLKNI